ncbi:MAG: RNA 2'-phosphotransferase [Deltaproteobacteria bacterium]|nr:RNA 2'-phosphotransferase [Deltaproteobacteria bacterium]MBW2256029.1 RNA 2'-phosphotransferase [Deltaproteobacteria bacterium]
MPNIDPVRLSKTMAFLLRHQPERGGLELDRDGWVEVAELARGASKLLKTRIEPGQVTDLVQRAGVRRFEVREDRIRAVSRRAERRSRPLVPDILYHATTSDRVERLRKKGVLTVARNRPVYLSPDEPGAWRAAHRLSGGRPMVLYVDASRAWRRGVQFQCNRRNGLFVARSIPFRHVLNLQPRFAEQISAGGIPIVQGPDGPQLALIQVTRKSGVTWEVAKGKLEPGEVPEETAIREVREEMGLTCDLRITRLLGHIRYGFVAPGGLPRLKTVFLYLMEPEGPIETFDPALNEGIGEVRWFSADEAAEAVTHTSLIPLMAQARRFLQQHSGRGE